MRRIWLRIGLKVSFNPNKKVCIYSRLMWSIKGDTPPHTHWWIRRNLASSSQTQQHYHFAAIDEIEDHHQEVAESNHQQIRSCSLHQDIKHGAGPRRVILFRQEVWNQNQTRMTGIMNEKKDSGVGLPWWSEWNDGDCEAIMKCGNKNQILWIQYLKKKATDTILGLTQFPWSMNNNQKVCREKWRGRRWKEFSFSKLCYTIYDRYLQKALLAIVYIMCKAHKKYMLWRIDELIYDGQLKPLTIGVSQNAGHCGIGFDGWWWANNYDLVHDFLKMVHLSIILMRRYSGFCIWCWIGRVEPFGQAQTISPKSLLSCMKLELCWKLWDQP